jgi:predicted AAA+ superfamily ATPase
MKQQDKPATSYIRAVNDYTVSSHQIFLECFKELPKRVIVHNIMDVGFTNVDGISTDLIDFMNNNGVKFTDGVSSVKFFDGQEQSSQYSIYRQLVLTFDNTVIEILGSANAITITFLSLNSDIEDSFVEFIGTLTGKYKVEKKRASQTFYTIAATSSGYTLEELKIKAEHSEEIIQDNYNDDFMVANDVISNAINDDKRGLILLHGIPGSGKTTYIKHLIASPGDRKIVYVPTHLTAALASPQFITFVKNSLNNSVLIFEDAEQILLSREAHESAREAVSNILNLTDGILAEALNVLLICTFNTDMEYLDKALLRKGRLLLQYKFDELNAAKADALATKLYGKTVGKAMPLSDIYGLEYDLIKPAEKAKVKFGFNQ